MVALRLFKQSVALLALLSLALSPALAASVYEQAEEEAFAGHLDEAIELYKRSMNEQADKSAEAAVRLFNIYKRLHRYDDAAALIPTIIKLTGDTSFRADLAELYRTAGKHYEAQRLYQEMLAQNPDDGQALYGLGCCLEATGSFDAAREYFNRAAGTGGSYAAAAKRQLSRISGADSRTSIDADVEIGRWPQNIRPIKVYIADGSQLSYYRSHMRQIVTDAVAAWNTAAHGAIELAVVDDPNTANIYVGWANSLNGALGVTMPVTSAAGGGDRAIKRARIIISIGTDSQGRPLPAETTASRQLYEARERVLHEVSLHELGHALGLRHSRRTDDIMADGIFGMNSIDVPSARDLQPGDVERLLALYGGSAASVADSDDSPASADDEDDQSGQAGVVRITKSSTTRSARGGDGDAGDSIVKQKPTSPELQSAMMDLSSHRYESSRDTLLTVLNRDPHNVMAHYLMAVTLVNLRDYKAAAEHYRLVTKLAPNGALSQRALDGLAKLKQ